ncbi:autotransporter assembly complex protein TamA [Microbulbifer yueqingensis]|uniref:Autotransporter secretion outer membrane protein TamA n=1 Tax=Microbulbifer yueqingensis TaxID=658219 RepID=A0A1G8UPA3_9GAMM|nr:BamA/TamA family outer membrane protein [Microbulbifer yueqingensis]SDJ55494.1 autotransporter secretion outer membrane protein TamA [Microbulbifer yueqingensis]
MSYLRVLTGFFLAAVLLGPLQVARAIPFFDQLPDFTVRVEGDRQLQEWLEEQLEELRKGSNVLENYEDPRDVARYERGSLERLLRSRGYYDSNIRESVSDGDILYRIEPGPRYLIKSIRVEMPSQLERGFGGLPLRVGDPLVATKVKEGVSVIEQYLNDNACLLNVDVSYKATVIHSEAAARLVYRVAPSPEVVVGQVYVEGLESVDAGFLRDKLKIESGECFKRNQLDAAQLRLLRTNLVAGVGTEVSEPYGGVVDITFRVQERKHRTVKLGVGYTSSEGAGVSAGWEHRNVFRRGEKIDIESKANPVQQSLEARLLVPRFLRDDQGLTGQVELSNKEVDAYTAESLRLGAVISRDLSKHRTASVGAELKFSEVEEDGGITENYSLLAFPLGLKWDTTDNPLDARKGATAALEVKPYLDLGDSGTSFVRSIAVATGYHTFAETRFEPTLALRIKAGVISGADNFDVPADERFYAGGGGSVRGYDYQALGPRRLIEPEEPDGEPRLSDPIGGRALSEISLEGRLRITEKWGGVLFVDGGNAYLDPEPRFDSLFWGVGFGVRYFTSFAPVRFDVAFPLDKREDLDDDFQVYVSLGQAF